MRALQIVDRSEQDLLSGLEKALHRQPFAETLRWWYGLASNKLTFADFFDRMRSRRQLYCLTVDTTPACDLVCSGMCYYHPEISMKQASVDEGLLMQAIKEAQRFLDLKTLVFAGKEPFLNPYRLFSLLQSCGARAARTFTVGVTTNGRHLHRHWGALQDLARSECLDFLDISLDSGIDEQHDSIRGVPGTFALAMSALREASSRLTGVRIGVASVLREDNQDGLLSLLHLAAPVTPYFHLSPIQPPPFTSTQPLKVETVIGFLQRLMNELKHITESGLEVTVSLPGLYLREAVQAGFFEWENVLENHQGIIYASAQVKGHTLNFSCSVLPEQACRLARITHDGVYLGHLHFLQAPQPELYATGLIQEESITSLYEKTIDENSYFHRILIARQSHECRKQPCWTSCFGGWTVADNAILAGEPLTAQPRLCRKSHSPTARSGE